MTPSVHRPSTPFEFTTRRDLARNDSSHNLESLETYGYQPLATSPSVSNSEINRPGPDPITNFAPHYRISPSDSVSPETESLLSADRNDDSAEFYYEPLSTQADIYDSEIDRLSDFDSDNLFSPRDCLARIGASQYSSPPLEVEPLPDLDLEEGYEADDEGPLGSLGTETLHVRFVEQAALYSPRISGEIEDVEEGEDWRLAPDLDLQAILPDLARRPTLIGQSFGTFYESDTSSLPPRWMGRNFQTECRSSDSEDEKQDSLRLRCRTSLRAFLNRSLRRTIQHFELVAGDEHYPEAAEFFAIDASTGAFTNPFTDPSYSINQRNLSVEQLSPLTRPNGYGRNENRRSTIPQAQSVSPASPISSLGQFEDDGIPVSLLHGRQTSERGERRSSREFGLGISGAPVIFEPTPSNSSASHFSDGHSETFFTFPPPEDRRTFSTSELDWTLNESLFEDAAHEFFSGINVEDLIADQRSGQYTLEDYDELYLGHAWSEDLEELNCQWPYNHWLPHSIASLANELEGEECLGCPCRECSDARYHDFDCRCSCRECQEILWEEMVEMHRLERRILREEEELARPGSPKRKFVELEESQESKARPQLRFETQKAKDIQNTEEGDDNSQPADAHLCT